MADGLTPRGTDALLPSDEAIAGFPLDGTVKGVPPGAKLRLDQVAAQGWNLLRGDMPFPLAVLRVDVMRRNSAWIAGVWRCTASMPGCFCPRMNSSRRYWCDCRPDAGPRRSRKVR